MDIGQDVFLARLEAATQRDGWYLSPRAARIALQYMRSQPVLKRPVVREAIERAYRHETTAHIRADKTTIMDLFDMTMGPQSASPTMRTLFNDLQKKADLDRAVTPGISLKKQFERALRQVKDHAYAEYHNEYRRTGIGKSPLHQDVTLLLRESLERLPQDMEGVTADTLIAEVSRVAGGMPVTPPRRSVTQAAEMMWSALQAIRPRQNP